MARKRTLGRLIIYFSTFNPQLFMELKRCATVGDDDEKSEETCVWNQHYLPSSKLKQNRSKNRRHVSRSTRSTFCGGVLGLPEIENENVIFEFLKSISRVFWYHVFMKLCLLHFRIILKSCVFCFRIFLKCVFFNSSFVF